MKRFYKLVSTRKDQGGYAVLLDGKPVKTPSGADLLAGSQGLADQIILEWSAQKEKINPETMPLTQILTTKIDRIGHERAAMTVSLLKYIDTDLLCYRAEAEGLAAKQAEQWGAPLAWFAKKFHALETTNDLKALKQPAAAHAKVKDYVAALSDDRFTILQLVASLSGSIVLGIAFIEKEIDAAAVYDASLVEETHKAGIYNEALYGAAPNEEKARAALRRDLTAAGQYLDLI